jgi:hypothetical protein
MIKAITQTVNINKIILDYYSWDEKLELYYNKEKAIEMFKWFKEEGIDKSVELDFSVFYDKVKIVNLYNLHFANKRSKDLLNFGFKILINFNLIHPDYFEVADCYLPKTINTLVCDNNHKFSKTYLQKDREVFEMLYKSGRKIKNIIFIDGKKNHAYLLPILKSLEAEDTTYTFIPSRANIISIFMRGKK